MMALEATVQIQGAQGQRTVPLQEFYFVPGSTPERENVLAPGELITSVTLPRLARGTRSYYLKRRDRASYEFALASAAVVAQMQGQRVQRMRVALGGIGTKPWRSWKPSRCSKAAMPMSSICAPRLRQRCETPGLCMTMPSKSNWPNAPSCARCKL